MEHCCRNIYDVVFLSSLIFAGRPITPQLNMEGRQNTGSDGTHVFLSAEMKPRALVLTIFIAMSVL
jgi:hypothetical protein